MVTINRFASILLVLMLAVPAVAEDAKPGDTITWSKDLTAAFLQAKEQQKPLMICVNAKSVAGEKEEPAAKGLREVIYKDPRVVTASRKFICAFLTPAGSSKEYGELRAIGIEGGIISPQHIFVHPDGDKLLFREEYWSYGSGESGIKKLLEMMSTAATKLKGGEGTPVNPEGGDAPADPGPAAPAPAAPDGAADADHAKARGEWIKTQLERVVSGAADDRVAACRSLVENDEKGDCVAPLVALIPVHQKENPPLVVDIVRSVGVPGLEIAAEEVGKLLKHKDRLVRGNAAVTLEYIGSPASIKPLKARASKEKDASIANHMYRALGRCGANDKGVRGTLLKKAEGSKSEFAALGPIIGLAYFDKDKAARRGLEKLLKKMGIPGGRRGGFQNVIKRAVIGLALAQIGDEKSGKFVREELLKQAENMQGRWSGAIRGFYVAVARSCEGEEEAKSDLEDSVRRTLEFAQLETPLVDEMRKDRDTTKFAGNPVGRLVDQFRRWLSRIWWRHLAQIQVVHHLDPLSGRFPV